MCYAKLLFAAAAKMLIPLRNPPLKTAFNALREKTSETHRSWAVRSVKTIMAIILLHLPRWKYMSTDPARSSLGSHHRDTTTCPKCTSTLTQLHVMVFLRFSVGRDSSVGIATELRAGRYGDRIPVRGDIFRTRPDRLWGLPSLLYNGYRVFCLGVKRSGRGIKYPPHLTPRLKKE